MHPKFIFIALIFISWLGCASSEVAAEGPELRSFPAIKADAVGGKLRDSMIWTNPPSDKPGAAIVFRKTFELPQKPPGPAMLCVFADARYILWVNGSYVDRGPSRFQPNGPQYDAVDIAAHLRQGRNVIALLAIGNLSGGKIMRHAPGLTALLSADGGDLLRTDESWKWSDGTRFRAISATWADLRDSLVDARFDDGDWTQAGYDDSKWNAAAKITGEAWGPLTRTLIPPLRETPVPVTFANHASLPVTLQAGEKLEFDATRLVQAYPVIEMEADAGAELSLEPFGVKYLARAGRQSHFTIDSRGFSHGAIRVKSGRATITGFRLIERLYPYERLGSFQSNDEFLNRLWEMCARSCEVLSEDSYVDCADRERVEWMDDDPPGFNITRTVMAGPGAADGKPVYSDPRLLAQLVRRTALTLQPDGWVKAHTCSDRYDIHAKMEDRACEWVAGVRRCHDATGDDSLVREVWPAIAAQMDYFLALRTPRGLVRARDWVVWGNPTGYMIGETTTLNAFVQRALADATVLGNMIGETAASAKFAKAADDLLMAINSVLWDEKTGAYFSGYFEEADIAESLAAKHKLTLPLTERMAPSTLHANVFALDRGIVPPERRGRVIARMLEQQNQLKENPTMIYYYLMTQLYALDEPEFDQRVLSLLREKWAGMTAAPWQCSWEDLRSGSKAHIYGMFPGYFLSACVLGVRRDAPVADKTIFIEPHLADLTEASGSAVTEFGPVQVSWKRNEANLSFDVQIPDGVKATLRLPHEPGQDKLTLDGKLIQGDVKGNRLTVELTSGRHAGKL